jgi:hypothetical protein
MRDVSGKTLSSDDGNRVLVGPLSSKKSARLKAEADPWNSSSEVVISGAFFVGLDLSLIIDRDATQ